MKTVDINEAKTNLTALLDQVANGKEIIIERNGQPVAKLVPYKTIGNPRQPGYWKGKVVIHPDFDELPDQIKKAFGCD